MRFLGDNEEYTPKGRIAPRNLPESYLLSAGYDGKAKKVYLRLYEPIEQQVYLWYDDSNHLPYCFSKRKSEDLKNNKKLENHSGFVKFTDEVKCARIKTGLVFHFI